MEQQLSGGINEMPGVRGVGRADDGTGGSDRSRSRPAARRREGVRRAVREAAGTDRRSRPSPARWRGLR